MLLLEIRMGFARETGGLLWSDRSIPKRAAATFCDTRAAKNPLTSPQPGSSLEEQG